MFAVALVPLALLGASGSLQHQVSYASAIATAARDPLIFATHQASRTLKQASKDTPLLDVQPVINAQVGPRFTPSSERGLEFQASITQSISLAGTSDRNAKALFAGGIAQASEADAEIYRHQLSVSNAWLRLRTAETLARISARNVERETEYVRLVAQLVAAGESSAADQALADASLLQAKLQDRRYRGEVSDRAGRLAYLLRRDSIQINTEGEWPEPELPEVNTWAQAALHVRNPLHAAIRSRVRARRREGEANTARAAPRLSVGLQGQRDALKAGIAQVLVGLSLPVFDTDVANRAETEADVATLRGQADRIDKRHAAFVDALRHELEHTDEIHELLIQQVVPNAERAVRLRQFEIEAGEATHLALLEAKRILNRSRIELVTARFERTWIRVQAAALLKSRVEP